MVAVAEVHVHVVQHVGRGLASDLHVVEARLAHVVQLGPQPVLRQAQLDTVPFANSRYFDWTN